MVYGGLPDPSEVFLLQSMNFKCVCSHVGGSQSTQIRFFIRFSGVKNPMNMVSDPSDVFRVPSVGFGWFCSHMGGSQKVKIFVTKVLGGEKNNEHGLGPVGGVQGAVSEVPEVLQPHWRVPEGQDFGY